MGVRLTREEYLSLSEEDRMVARLESLRAALEAQRDAAPIRRRGVPMAEAGVLGPEARESGIQDAQNTTLAKPVRQARTNWLSKWVKRSTRLPAKGEQGTAFRLLSPNKVSRAADEAGITQEQAERFLQELEKKSAG